MTRLSSDADEMTTMGGPILTIPTCLTEISQRLAEASAVAKAALTCAAAGSEREALRIAMDLDEVLGEVATLHGAMRFLGRLDRRGVDSPEG